MKKIAYFAFVLTGVLLAGCNQNPNNTKLDALSQKLDTVLHNQAAINKRLDELPKMISDAGRFYSTNEANFVWFCHTNEHNFIWACHTNSVAALLNAMSGQEDSIENTVNAETKRLVYGNAKITQMKINLAKMDLQTNFTYQSADLKMIKFKLGIPDY